MRDWIAWILDTNMACPHDMGPAMFRMLCVLRFATAITLIGYAAFFFGMWGFLRPKFIVLHFQGGLWNRNPAYVAMIAFGVMGFAWLAEAIINAWWPAYRVLLLTHSCTLVAAYVMGYIIVRFVSTSIDVESP